MKQNKLTLTIGVVLVVIFGLLLFFFQVHMTEVALVTTFGKPTKNVVEPGLYFRWPWPIQRVIKFDKRTQSFEDKYEETYTSDGRNLIITVYAGWSISDPSVFRERFGDSVSRAENELTSLVRSAKDAVVGKHPLSHFISTDEDQLQFVEIEQEMLGKIQPVATNNYGINVKFLGIKKLGLPESTTEKVFERMKEERQRVVQKLQAEGEAIATRIRSEAQSERAQILNQAQAEVTRLRGEAEAQAAKALAVFEENPELAVFLLKIDSLEKTLKERSTLILDQRTPPFDLLDAGKAATPAPKR